MIQFNEFETTPEYLQEKLLLIQNSSDYGQALYVSGGGGSGKGFAIKNFLEGNKFKVRDVDEWKKSFIKLAKLKGRNKELQNLDLRNPKDVFFLHNYLKSKGIKEKTFDLLFTDTNRNRLPNVLFDVTLADVKKLKPNFEDLQRVGYKPENIHIVWVLANYSIAVRQNKDRTRVVPDDILLATHEGAANTMYNMITKNNLPPGMNGGIYVILNKPKHTIYYTDKAGDPIKNSQGESIIKDFKYITVKKPGKPIRKDAILTDLHKWVIENVPKTELTKHIWKGTNE